MLLAPDGTVVLTNSVWGEAVNVLSDERFRVGVGGDYFALARLVRDDRGADALIDALQELSRGARRRVSADYALPHPRGRRPGGGDRRRPTRPPGHLATGTLPDDVAAALEDSGLPPGQLVLELTETGVARDPARATAQFAALRISGVEVSLDDFGSGSSSLSQLVSIPAGILEIDRSLISGLEGRTGQSAAAVAAVVGLGRACGMRTLAEGVERPRQLAMAAELGCTFAQGFHIARPMPADDLLPWIEARSTGALYRRDRSLVGARP